ncbi:TPA: hypothetical protein PXM90_001293 [Yersinia enterocolitica]|nr:hypothetical protein [Yersinia enterocolitica]HDL6999563.1 hypothetical protein [Yersinia enterocolitica]HDL7107402.1 hypothetical protein [Yersinia enterocolitica]HDL7115873.1 hypothetical protein [Yersinia enterocolitica]
MTCGRPNASIEDGTLLRNRVQQAVAQASVLPIVAGTLQQNPQAERAALPVRRREGLKPDGRLPREQAENWTFDIKNKTKNKLGAARFQFETQVSISLIILL